jgi:hypothetical protein
MRAALAEEEITIVKESLWRELTLNLNVEKLEMIKTRIKIKKSIIALLY